MFDQRRRNSAPLRPCADLCPTPRAVRRLPAKMIWMSLTPSPWRASEPFANHQRNALSWRGLILRRQAKLGGPLASAAQESSLAGLRTIASFLERGYSADCSSCGGSHGMPSCGQVPHFPVLNCELAAVWHCLGGLRSRAGDESIRTFLGCRSRRGR